jgi:hypothetical protein
LAAISASAISPLASSFSLLYNSSSRVSVEYSAFWADCQFSPGTSYKCPLTLNDSVNGTSLLAETTVDTLCHVQVVLCRSPRSILSSLGFDRNSLSRADGFTQLARFSSACSLIIKAMLDNLPIHRSSPLGYRRKACSPLNRGDRGPFSKGYMIV